ncbi:hypothetical protein Bca52824_044139 [Brassica carinata]|uniref:Uncharacterized protein n=1 Tax=Brassica carinata TaxID=52824 RepID=A0A8X7S001_BRACI|nr:hypothetical protein Bca52824_044139 [Brassica carinata]
MKEENAVSGITIPLHARPLTRAYSKMITSSEVDATTQSLGHVARANTKRAALDEKKASAPKKLAVLKDITNEISPKLENIKQIEKVDAVSTVANILKVIDIDSNEKDPLLCSLYAPEIYHNLRVAEIYTPTPKTFLRRFLRAAHASDLEKPSVEMEFLANYLMELTLIDYEFLKFLPSVIAASAVFLAKWTLNQSSHPWNPTLEHYTTFKASDLKASVHALQDLQLNIKGCSLASIRMKYKQEKFKSLAVLSSPELPDRLF